MSENRHLRNFRRQLSVKQSVTAQHTRWIRPASAVHDKWFSTRIIPRGDIEERYGESIGGNTKEIPEPASDGFDVMSESTDWDRWTWDTATGLSVEQVREKLTSSSLDTSDWLITGCDSKASRHLMVQAAQAGCTVYLKPYLTLEFEAHDDTTFKPGELPVQSTLPEPMAEAAPEVSDYQTQIDTWLQATSRTKTWYREIIADALRLEEGERAAPSPGRVAHILRSAGWVKDKYQSGKGKDRAVVWRTPK